MGIVLFVGLVVVAVGGYVVYQLVKSKQAVTVGNAVTAAKADVAAVKSDVKKS